MTRPDSQNCRPGVALCVAMLLLGCSETRFDDGPVRLERDFEDSGQNLAVSFDGVNDYATTGTAEFPAGRANQTISVRFMAQSLPGKQALISPRKDFESGIEIGLRDGVATVWRIFGGKVLLSAKTPIAVNTWHHLAYTYDTTTHQIFVDGLLVASTGNVTESRTPTTCWLGSVDGTRDFFHGVMDDVHVYDVVRTPQALAAEASNPNAHADTTGLVLELTFDESQKNPVAFDHSSFGNDALLGDGVEQYMPIRVSSASAGSTR